MRRYSRGWLGAALKVRVKAPAERGRANAAVEEIVAGALGVPKSHILIVKGKTCAWKVVEISDLSEAEVYRRFPKPPGSL